MVSTYKFFNSHILFQDSLILWGEVPAISDKSARMGKSTGFWLLIYDIPQTIVYVYFISFFD